MGISHFKNYGVFSWSFLELLHEALFRDFLCCTAASGPYLVTNRKALILHEHEIDHGKSLKRLTLCSLSLMIRNFSVVVWLRLRAQLHIFLRLSLFL